MITDSARRWRRSRSAAIGALTLVALLTVALPPPTAARGPWTPAPPTRSYSPRHVWQTRDNCVFASGQMLVDKWTHGRIRAAQGRLRKASQVEEGGAGFRDLALGIVRSTGIRLRWSPAGGDPMTWWQLLDRLERQGGAVLFGEYGRLPPSYQRWAPRFARSANDHHAVYVERYDRAHGRVWLMDPLAVGGFPGEWIDVGLLRRFARFKGTLVSAAATPPRRRPTTAPLTDRAYRLGAPFFGPAIVAGTKTPVSVPMTILDDFPLPAAHRLRGTWERLDDPAGALARDDALIVSGPVPSGPAPASSRRPLETTVTVSADARPSSRGFAFGVPAPDQPGKYRLTLALVPAGAPIDRPARTLAPVEVRVVGPYAGSIVPTVAAKAQLGTLVRVSVAAVNLGIVDWRPAPAAETGPASQIEASAGRPAVLTITWRKATGERLLAREVELPLPPGDSTRLELDVPAPPTAGAWTIELDVLHSTLGSLVATGMQSPPAAVGVDPLTADPTR